MPRASSTLRRGFFGAASGRPPPAPKLPVNRRKSESRSAVAQEQHSSQSDEAYEAFLQSEMPALAPAQGRALSDVVERDTTAQTPGEPTEAQEPPRRASRFKQQLRERRG